MDSSGEQLIGASAAARALGVSPQRVRDLIKDGRLPAFVQRLAAEREEARRVRQQALTAAAK
jgi:hypothetical protein